MDKIKIGIVGYGNIGRGVEQAIKRNDDMELAAVFTRRDPATVSIQTEGAAVKHFDDMVSMKGEVDVMILCGGSATDLPVIGPVIAAISLPAVEECASSIITAKVLFFRFFTVSTIYGNFCIVVPIILILL